LLYTPPLSTTSQARLEALRTSNDGFAIAEIDLKLRGSGEVLGAKQSGELAFQIATEEDGQQWMELAFQMARRHLSNDPDLESTKGQAIRCLLNLFHKEHFAMSGVERA
jgi:ATP-dependent DNA helicase RecG